LKPDDKNFILTLTCPDTECIALAVTEFISRHGGCIHTSSHYSDHSTEKLFLRTEFHSAFGDTIDVEELREEFVSIAEKYSMDWNLYDDGKLQKVLIAVSKQGHCLSDLLHKMKEGQLRMEVPAVVSNHPDMEGIARWYGIDYYHLPITPETKTVQERHILEMVEKLGIDLVVLARYMQVLSPETAARLKGKCINIHHSFLPGFKGAAPHKQAHSRGVKLIGATAHYVTDDLDEGPIIEQAVERVDHTFDVEDIAATCRDIETVVLSRAVKWHIEHRILMNGIKTVVFR
jgi:formyltetrahydrofolate deformylase